MPELFCQSCSMPIDHIDDRGTEKDGSKNNEYCKYCYQDGAFTEPNLSFQQMKDEIMLQMKKLTLDDSVIQSAIDRLSYLKRWEK